jgi:hypothetical protein
MKLDNLQRAIFTRLNGYAPLTSAVAGVYSRIPQSDDAGDVDEYPFVSIGSINGRPFDTKGTNGVEAVVQIDTWSRSTSDLERRAIMGHVYDALQKHDLTITDCNLIDCRFDGSSEMDDPDGITTHGISLFRVTYEY